MNRDIDVVDELFAFDCETMGAGVVGPGVVTEEVDTDVGPNVEPGSPGGAVVLP